MQKPPLKDWICTVVFNQECGPSLKRLRLKPVDPLHSFQCFPGQFVMLDLPEAAFHFRRPFSVLSMQPDGSFDLYYKRVGKGTHTMWELPEDVVLRVLGPLGNRFESSDFHPEKTLLIGGGIGIAPLFCLAQEMLGTYQATGHCFYGVRTQAELGLQEELHQVFESRLHIATDDGSTGFTGNVCDLLILQSTIVQAVDRAFVCGPTRMMEAVSGLLHQLNPKLSIQVSLEERMPCGTGACTGCVTARTDRNLPSKVCLEGPVFDAKSILWRPTENSEHVCGVSSCSK